MGRVRKFEDTSHTRGTEPTSGVSGNSTPNTVNTYTSRVYFRKNDKGGELHIREILGGNMKTRVAVYEEGLRGAKPFKGGKCPLSPPPPALQETLTSVHSYARPPHPQREEFSGNILTQNGLTNKHSDLRPNVILHRHQLTSTTFVHVHVCAVSSQCHFWKQ